MFKQKKSLKEFFKTNILEKKLIIVFASIISLLVILGSFIHTNNFSQNKSIANNNTTTQSVDNSKTQTYNNVSNEVSSQKIKFSKATLINDNIGVPVLYYHSVTEPASNEVTITPEKLRIQLKYIKDQGYITLTMSELKDYLLNNFPIPEKSIVITFDDGYMDNYYNAFPILKEFNMDATIFCITSDLNGSYYLSKEAIKEMSSYGIDIESHTVNHPKLSKMTYEEQLTELKESKKTLESITGKTVDSVAYPFGDFNEDSVKAAKSAGYTLAFTTNRGLADRDDNPLKLDRIYISSAYDMNTFKEVLTKTKK
ncbi:polysaccharide deacetylase family protein [Clostridium sp.]|uniref:polysaccharide deacetylase family protein n=1 Tax=Clostridium sp. TaxID=1506 RepID=UPI00283B7125|nr:polysaccharide deacetylase family protein [Clostridium sp.]MDR3596987.1 polysaccharide deacetylase family protein [Clostridium sp.]